MCLASLDSLKGTQKTDAIGNGATCFETIERLRKAVELCPHDREGLILQLHIAANSLDDHFDLTGNLVDADKAISVQQGIVDLIPKASHRRRASELSNLGALFARRFKHSRAPADLNGAVSAIQTAVQLVQEGHADLPSWLHNLGGLLMDKFALSDQLFDIDKAVSTFQNAVKLTTVGHPSLPERLDRLGASLQGQFEVTGNLEEISQSVWALQTAVQLTPEHHPNRPQYLHNLGSALSCRFTAKAHLPNIDDSITACRSAAELTATNHPLRASTLENLGNSLALRYGYTGNFSNLEEGILLLRKAVEITQKGDSMQMSRRLCNLGGLLNLRFLRTQDMGDIEEAIFVQKEAMETYPGHETKVYRCLLNKLANSFATRWKATNNIQDIREAIAATEKALQMTPEGHADLPSYLGDLGVYVMCSGDLFSSVWLHQRAVELTPEGHPHLPGLLFNLGDSLRNRYEYYWDREDLTQAIQVLQRAIQLTPKGHARLSGYHWRLGKAQLTRSRTFVHSDQDLMRGVANFKLAATCSSGQPSDRLRAALWWARSLLDWAPQSPDILVALDIALDMLALKSGLEQTIRTRHIQLQDCADTALEAAAIAFSVGRVDKALEWLEQGRCLVWNQINNLRTPIDALHTYDPNLAARVLYVSKQLEIAGSSRKLPHVKMPLQQKISLQEEASAHLELAEQWEELLCQVRVIPGFESFLQPTKCSALLQSIPKSGTVVIINVHKRRCDAICLVPGRNEPLHIPLPNLSEDKVKQHRNHMQWELRFREPHLHGEDRLGVHGEHSARAMGVYPQPRIKSPIRGVLHGLWTDVVRPILDKLALSKSDQRHGNKAPRIWWCPTGALSFLPLHAAGTYGPGTKSETVLDYVVSSYTPTVSAVTDRVKNCRPIDNKISGLFLTSQPIVRGAPEIPYATYEVHSNYEKVMHQGIRALKVEGEGLTVGNCLTYLEEYSSVHFACHAGQNLEDGLKSRFYLHSGTLDLATILKMDLKNADLAFLSACETSTGDSILPDEAVHLAAGMLAAGYRRVVGTMWYIGDHTSPLVSENFYNWLFRHMKEGCGFDGTLSAYALHHAIRTLQDDLGHDDDAILAWAPFVHFGY
ncbi:hypothetical protein FA13DRAFT_1843468 [Coprinellus micaceus]|uniref:CHAT domain-containing protein n=1 Tax=Coprinellus micaceus TaxID=71717 RepID=A0A4Y7SDF5_COPMI|nr:hypothetical protein FA13DRAFT_1843468 [Coprinellus micaceus]